ncbi:MAG: hypothetical protein EAX86_10585 [Candidatus Heimdallarchaeota archaeon]|nr:hypothetical protein [Candidatus Heimdallarchaeota archaeon]
MVSFGELESFLAFFVFTSQGKTLISQDFRDKKGRIKFPERHIFTLLTSAYEVSQGLKEESISEGQIFHVDFASMRIAGIQRPEGIFSLVAAASASLLDIEFKLRTLMTLFLGSFSHKFGLKSIRLGKREREEFYESIQTVMSGESRYMTEALKKSVDECLFAWVTSDDAINGACVTSFTGAVIVNQMNLEILPAAMRAIRGAFAAHLEKPRFFMAVSGASNIFVYILGEGLLLLVDANPAVPASSTVERVESKVDEIRNLIL